MPKDINENQLRKIIANGIIEHGNQKNFAVHLDVSESLLSNVIRDRRDPPPKLLTALGYERVITYRQIVKD